MKPAAQVLRIRGKSSSRDSIGGGLRGASFSKRYLYFGARVFFDLGHTTVFFLQMFFWFPLLRHGEGYGMQIKQDNPCTVQNFTTWII